MCMSLSFLALFAENEPISIRVDRRNGGPSALVNKYRDVLYSPVEGQPYNAVLTCEGDGYVACRVPRNHTVMTLNPSGHGLGNNHEQISAGVNAQIVDAINQLIEESETEFDHGRLQGRTSKTIAVRIPNTRGYNSHNIVARWNYDENGDGTIIITITSGVLHFGRI